VRDIVAVWGIEASLLGVDLLEDGELFPDLDARTLEAAVGDRRFRLLVSPVGGQGIVLGRGNQQLNGVLDRLRREDLIVVSSPDKLAALGGRPLVVDAPTPALNTKFAGAHRILTGATDEAVYPIR
jgi:predicted polyphosphate/ATP-dependent NAD kinase